MTTIELRYVPHCPLVGRVRTLLAECLQQTGNAAAVRETEGPYPSPTLLINGVDVATGSAPRDGVCCRLDLPTRDQIQSALSRRPHSARSPASTPAEPGCPRRPG